MDSLCNVLTLFCLAFPSSLWANGNSGPDYLLYPKKWSPSVVERGGISLNISDKIAKEYLFHAGPEDLNLIEKMMQVWNDQIPQVEGLNMAFFRVPASVTPNLEYTNIEDYNWDHTMGIYLHSKWFPGRSPTALAITRLRMAEHNPGEYNQWLEITHADIILNNYHNKFRIYPGHFYTDGVRRFDLSTTILHELGHFLGLPHTERSTRAVMYENFGSKQNKWKLTNYDSELLTKLYFTPSPFFPTFQHLELPLVSYNSISRTLELDVDGQCRHYQNGRLIGQHSIDLGKALSTK